MRVFITGALGFIGGALGDRYRADGHEITGVDIRADADADRGVLAGDITEPGPWQEALGRADLVLHTAAVVSNAGDAEPYWRLNVRGTRLALDAAAAGDVGRFVHFSSVRAFGDTDWPDGVDEQWPVRTQGRAYVDTKVASEQVVLQAHAAGEVPVTVIRPGDVYGPRSRPWTILPVEMIRAGRFLLPAMGQGIFSPTYIDNLVDGVVAAAASADAAGQVFILSDGRGIATKDFFGHYYRMLAKRPVLVPTRVARALAVAGARLERLRGRETELGIPAVDYLTRRGTYSIAKARRQLGYEPAVDLADGMRRTEAWLNDKGLLA